MSLNMWTVALSFACLAVMFVYVANGAVKFVVDSREAQDLVSLVCKYPIASCKRHTCVSRTATQRSVFGQYLWGLLEYYAQPAPARLPNRM